jgi:hypothetical protein
MKNNVFNVGLSDANLSKQELLEKIKTYIPDFAISYSDFYEDPDKRDYIVSNKKIESTPSLDFLFITKINPSNPLSPPAGRGLG